ncbi:diguanylate cyclase [Desulfovibrio gilichinskyi]|uniref:diguanylate cyclase n=1 Tax=Desulfovibrio gilichinskyi TaxID=1519643 RepID=A0A1X7D4E4_9BACT|nr:diguanylate cyclase [Desulfovibrio gilichinskyi]SMF08751.1 PAS domain S-box-containing protein/diguanylate cyclase (GGDEF) domain-containing protein [Desulfovibrio gilichinskyi]
MNKELDTSADSADIKSLRQKYEALEHKIAIKCPECGQVQFRKIFAHAQSAIVVLNNNGDIVFANNAFNSITGFSQKEILHQPIHQILLSADTYTAGRIKTCLSNSDNNTTLIFQMVNKNHEKIWVDMSIKNIKNNNLCENSICIFNDITVEKENELRKEELIDELMEVKELQEDNSAQLSILLQELDDKNLKLEKEISERKKAEEKLRESEERFKSLSITDQLTGLYNRRHLQEVACVELDKSNNKNTPLCTLLMDVDNFKNFNDTYGHCAGDVVLKSVGRIIKKSLREHDSGFRYGGEEFVIFLPETESKEAALIAEQIRETLAKEEFHPQDDEPVQKTISIGIAQYQPEETLDDMLKRADENMYRAKIKGKNRVHF